MKNKPEKPWPGERIPLRGNSHLDVLITNDDDDPITLDYFNPEVGITLHLTVMQAAILRDALSRGVQEVNKLLRDVDP